MNQPQPLHSLEQLNGYSDVISHHDDSPIALQLSEGERFVVAVLLLNDDEVSLITTRWSSHEVFSVLSKIDRSGLKIDTQNIHLVTQNLFNVVVSKNRNIKKITAENVDDNDALKQFRSLVEYAVIRKHPASDIHAEFDEENGRLRMRINGFLEYCMDMLTADAYKIFGAAWYSYVHDKAKEAGSSFQPDQPQAGNGCVELDEGRQVLFRWQSKPAGQSGFDIIIRLLSAEGELRIIPLEEAGYHTDQLDLIYSAANTKGGAIIFSGDTGSGKSTSLAALMDLIHTLRPKSSLVSLENPREYNIPNVRQTTVRDSHFADWLKIMLRCDYETLMTGEVRTESEVKGFARSVMAGHQGLTTIHTADAMTIIQRLEDLGIPREILGGKRFLNLLVHQALIPTLCQHCKKSFVFSDEAKDNRLRARLKDVGISETTIYGHGEGCEHCQSDLGVAGRTVVAEIIKPTSNMKTLIAKGEDLDALDIWAKRYEEHPILGKPAIAHAIYKIKQGITSPQLVEFIMGNINEEALDRGIQLTSIDMLQPLEQVQQKVAQRDRAAAQVMNDD